MKGKRENVGRCALAASRRRLDSLLKTHRAVNQIKKKRRMQSYTLMKKKLCKVGSESSEYDTSGTEL